ncbi:M23 family metallopeptidase [Zhengella sp. ZM62]|uniref:M23 family metallopeptidase n=1 Tax=Zhengella sedimenti TaxID=3390035 RepID=UPI00397573AC
MFAAKLRILGLALAAGLPVTAALAGDYGPPVDCDLGRSCFLQQMPDMEPGPGAADPYCGPATYDGHTGIDIRVRSMADMARGVSVLAMREGVVRGTRDGEDDRLVRTEADRKAIADRECGNGVLIDHGDGSVTQYCHMRQGSVRVRNGDKVARGQPIGQIGASGLAQFPHVHAELRIDGKPVDLLTGRPLDAGCDNGLGEVRSLFDGDFAGRLGDGDGTLLDAGFASGAVDHDALGETGAPRPPDVRAGALTGWAWFANLRKGDRIRLRLNGPAGGVIADVTSKPMDRSKATYSVFAGKRGAPAAGEHGLLIELLRGGEVIRSARRTLTIGG